MDPPKPLFAVPEIFGGDERNKCPAPKMPARRRAGRATGSASEPAGAGIVQAVYSYVEDQLAEVPPGAAVAANVQPTSFTTSSEEVICQEALSGGSAQRSGVAEAVSRPDPPEVTAARRPKPGEIWLQRCQVGERAHHQWAR